MNITKWQGFRRVFTILCLAACLSACANNTLDLTTLERGFFYKEVETNLFQIVAITRDERTNNRPNTARIYLEGDGTPWSKGQPNSNPTGRTRLGFQLFLQDKKAIAYLARPCYEHKTMPSNCTAELWTNGRYSEAVVDALIEAIEQAAPDGAIELVGYSGGGTLAALIAHRLPRVSRILTIAANLDHDAWSEHHGTLPLDLSLNPVNDTHASDTSELHLFGSRDSVAPAALALAYFENHAAAVGLVEGFTHHCCWLEQWLQILDKWDEQHPYAPPRITDQ
ncbi:MAG: hypothetical protein RI942_2181 [Pseudomonadota bacterium]|jgi:hypothetical protein